MASDDRPPWLTPEAADAMQRAAEAALAYGLDAATAARDIIWALHPSLPALAISEAADAVLSGARLGAGSMPPSLRPADTDDLCQALHYALRFNERGKPLGVQARADTAQMAGRLVRHLERAGFAVMKRPPIKAHSAG